MGCIEITGKLFLEGIWLLYTSLVGHTAVLIVVFFRSDFQVVVKVSVKKLFHKEVFMRNDFEESYFKPQPVFMLLLRGYTSLLLVLFLTKCFMLAFYIQ